MGMGTGTGGGPDYRFLMVRSPAATPAGVDFKLFFSHLLFPLSVADTVLIQTHRCV